MQNEKAFPRQASFGPFPTTNAGTGGTWALWKPSFAGEIVSINGSSTVAVAGNTTNYTTIGLYDITSAVTMASVSSSGQTIAANDLTAGTVSTTVANTKFAAGDHIAVVKAETGTGATWTTGCVTIEYVAGTYN